MLKDTGIVVIARNEGERLLRCLESCAGATRRIVYADSGSTDGSVERAAAIGAEVVELDMSIPGNAARGRNAGMRRLLELEPDLRYIFFVDGDCQVVSGFLEAAHAVLEGDEGLGAVCGQRLEIALDASLYNRLVHTEWNTPVGETPTSGGDVLVRAEAIGEGGGYDETMSCGEDPEMCFRLRRKGWRIRRIDCDMTRHDVSLHRFSSWWKRHARGGIAFAHGAALHLHGPEWFNLKEVVSVLFWGCFLPLVSLVAALFTGGLGLLGFLLHLHLWYRIRRWRVGVGDPAGAAGTYAAFVVLGKFAEAAGVVRFLLSRLTGRRSLYVEYKEYQ
jgi:glycosyltransferase involved in cell wall biosynthesis